MMVDSTTAPTFWTASSPKMNFKCYLTPGSYPLNLSSIMTDGELEMFVKIDYQLCHIATNLLDMEDETIDQQESDNVQSAADDDYGYCYSDEEMIDDSTTLQSITADSIALNLGHRNVANKAEELSQAVLEQSRAAPVVKALNENIAKKIKETNELLSKVVFNAFEDTIEDLICLKNLPHDEKEKLGKSLAECVNFDNFIELYIFADILYFEVLRAAVDAFLGDKNYRSIVMSNSYKNLNIYPGIYKNIFLFKFSP